MSANKINNSKKVKPKMRKISFVWKKPIIDKDAIVLNGKFFVFLFCSLVSSLVNLIFVVNLTRSPYTIGTLFSIPGAILLGFLSISLDLSKALHVIQVNTLSELYQEVNGKYKWANKIRSVRNRWFTIYVLYVTLSVVTSVSLSTISIGAGITRNANMIKQIDSAIAQGEKYYNIADATKDISLQGLIKQATDTTETDAISNADRAWLELEPLLLTYQEERIEFETQYGTAAVNWAEETDWHGEKIVPNTYWNKRNNEVASRVRGAGYTGNVSGPSLKNLNRSLFIKNVRENTMAAMESKKNDEAIEKLNNVNDATMQEAYNWVLELNNMQFNNPRTNAILEFDVDESKPVKVLVNSALTRLKALRVDVENDSGDIGSSSKIFMQVGSWVDGMSNKKKDTSDLTAALETKASGSFGTTEVMMMAMLLFLSLLCELAINQFSPKTLISRKMLSQFAKYFPSDFDVDDFMLGVLIRQLKYGDISQEKFDRLSEQATLMTSISKQQLLEKYLSKPDDNETEKESEYISDLKRQLTDCQQSEQSLRDELEQVKSIEVQSQSNTADLEKEIFSLKDSKSLLEKTLAENEILISGLKTRNSELEGKVVEMFDKTNENEQLFRELDSLNDVIESAKEELDGRN